MKLTKDQRHTAYIILKNEMEAAYGIWGFCVWIGRVFDIGDRKGERLIKKSFPELWRKRPKNPYQVENESQGCLWFDYHDIESNGKRIELLKQCIEETY